MLEEDALPEEDGLLDEELPPEQVMQLPVQEGVPQVPTTTC